MDDLVLRGRHRRGRHGRIGANRGHRHTDGVITSVGGSTASPDARLMRRAVVTPGFRLIIHTHFAPVTWE